MLNFRNSKGYFDPTATIAIYRADKELKARRRKQAKKRREASHEHHLEVSGQEKRHD